MNCCGTLQRVLLGGLDQAQLVLRNKNKFILHVITELCAYKKLCLILILNHLNESTTIGYAFVALSLVVHIPQFFL